MKPGPWSSTLFIGTRGSNAAGFKVEFLDHCEQFSASWINDKLLYIQVWWGRIASSDLILDVGNREFIYNEFANYGEITFCKEK
jgi:hypothetical protein